MKTPAANTALFPILMVNFIGTMGFSIVLPFMVIIVLKLGGNAVVYGALGATYSFFQLIGAPILGAWSDKIGRRKILLLSQAGTFFCWIIFMAGIMLPNHFMHINIGTGYILSVPLILIFAGRSLDGITGGNISVAYAYLADITTKADRKKNFGKMAAAANLGLIFGPLIAGALGSTVLGNLLPVIVAAFISLVAIVVIFYCLKDKLPLAENAVEGEQPDETTVSSLAASTQKAEKVKVKFTASLRLPYVGFFMVLYFLIFLAFNFFYVAFPVYIAGGLHWTVLQIGIFFSFLSGMMVIVQGPLLTLVSKKVSSAKLVIAGSVLLCVGFVMFSYSSTVILYIGAFFFSLGNGLMWPSFLALLSNTGDERTQGSIQGFASSAGSMASIVGLVSGGFLYHSIGAHLFLVACGFILLIGLVAIRLIKVEKALG